jgi:CheY-like chemotaxis protein
MPAVNLERPVEILLVEDSPYDAELMEEALKEGMLDHHVTRLEDGEQALAHLRRAPAPDLILLDLNLPRKSGNEVLEEIKNDPRLRRIPVVIMTASDDDETMLKLYQSHANCCVTKPTDSDEFVLAVKRIQHFWLKINCRAEHDES